MINIEQRTLNGNMRCKKILFATEYVLKKGMN